MSRRMTMREQLMASEADAQAERIRAFSTLEVYGVPRERARSVSNGIEVLATRYRRERQALVAEIADLHGRIAVAPCPHYERKHGLGLGLCSDCACWKRDALKERE